jgi:hypothetical protein
MATVTINVPAPAPPPAPTYSLELSKEEAQGLMNILNISERLRTSAGDGYSTTSQADEAAAGSIYRALRGAALTPSYQ